MVGIFFDGENIFILLLATFAFFHNTFELFYNKFCIPSQYVLCSHYPGLLGGSVQKHCKGTQNHCEGMQKYCVGKVAQKIKLPPGHLGGFKLSWVCSISKLNIFTVVEAMQRQHI